MAAGIVSDQGRKKTEDQEIDKRHLRCYNLAGPASKPSLQSLSGPGREGTGEEFPSIMDSPGTYLRQQRELRNLSLEEVYKATRIKEHFLKAIEEDCFDLCPSPFYVKGFLSDYARYLGLDPKSTTLRYQEWVKPSLPPGETSLQEKTKETFQFRPRIQTKSPARTPPRVLFVSAVSFCLFLFLYFYIASRPPAPLNVPSPGLQTAAPLEVAQEKQDRPVIEQIKQMELIGPKEVQAEPLCDVSDAYLGAGIEVQNGRPKIVGKGSEFRCENQRVYFFTRIVTPREGKIWHVWRWEGEEQHRIEMAVRPPSWSVYSYISLPPVRAGNWRVEVWDGDKMLTDLSFRAHSPKSTSSPS